MKRILAGVLLLLCLVGCAAPDTYLKVRPHTEQAPQVQQTNAVLAEDYQELKKAILSFVAIGQSEGVIHATNYNGSVEEDLTRAVYEVLKTEPLGAYAVDYMTYDCTLIINYYEIRVYLTFRRTPQEIEAVEPIATRASLEQRLQQAAENYEPWLALRVGGYRDQDVAAVIEEYCRQHPDTIMEIPQITVSVYPDTGSVRILEIDLNYQHTVEELRSMEVAVRESVDAAAEYIRYRESSYEKAELLFTYLMERFAYIQQDTVTPVYDALCRGVADPQGLSDAWKMICDAAGVPCYAVRGLKNGEDYVWNILQVGDNYRHLDLAECVMQYKKLVLQTDSQMKRYYWNQVRYPACEAEAAFSPVPPEEVPSDPAEPLPEASEDPTEETPPEPIPETETTTPEEPEKE